jgi:hypothetical protein
LSIAKKGGQRTADRIQFGLVLFGLWRVVANRFAGELRGKFGASGAVTHLVTATGDAHYFFLAFPALDRAMATACFWGLPAFISVLMLAETVLAELPRFKGTYKCTSGDTKKLRRKDLRRAADGVS